jgi:small-conductance mechanosensitive channel
MRQPFFSISVIGVSLVMLLLCGQPAAAGESKPAPAAPLKILTEPPDQAIPIDTEKIDKMGSKIGNEIDHMSKKAGTRFGDWVNSKAFLGITWVKLSFCLFLLLVVIAFRHLSRKWLQKWIDGNGDQASRWPVVLGKALSGPLALFILLYGSYAALSPMIVQLRDRQGWNNVTDFSARAVEIVALLGLAWFLRRLIAEVDLLVRKNGQAADCIWCIVFTHVRAPARLLVSVIVLYTLLPLLSGLAVVYSVLGYVLAIAFIGTVAWLAVQGGYALEDIILRRYRAEAASLTARRLRTQVRFLRGLLTTVIVVLAVASILMLFDKVRQLGTGVLASAGIMGVIVGIAAQRSIANLLVGLQIAISQPIRIDDVVIIEGEWGTVEEITSTYAVIKIWDLRRLIIPLSYLIEKPFQNWTRRSADLLGTVMLYADYTVEVEAVRGELHRILDGSDLWDRKAWGLQVTDAKENVVELRALMSADNASKLWDLRCLVREKLILFLQTNFPASMPKIRAEIVRADRDEA